MDFNSLIARVKAILLTPKTEWPVIAGEPASVAGLYKNYIVILAAIPAVFGFIKGSLIGSGGFGITVRTPIVSGIVVMLLSYALSLVLVYLVALIVDAMAPNFGGQKNPVQALKTVAYAFTASWVAGIAAVLGILGGLIALAAAAYGIYLLYLGLPHTMRCPPEKAGGYTAVTAILAFVLSLVIGTVVAGITTAGLFASGGFGGSSVQIDRDSALGKLGAFSEKMEQASKRMEAAKAKGDDKAAADAAGEALGTLLGGGDKVEALAPDALRAFLPDTLAGMARQSISVERNGAMGMQVSTGNARYADDSGERSIELEITDMGSTKGLMALAGFVGVESDKQTEHGYEKIYRDNGRLVQEEWDGQSRHGEFSIVIGERFQVKVNGQGLDMNQLKAALGGLNLAGLEALKDHGVKRG